MTDGSLGLEAETDGSLAFEAATDGSLGLEAAMDGSLRLVAATDGTNYEDHCRQCRHWQLKLSHFVVCNAFSRTLPTNLSSHYSYCNVIQMVDRLRFKLKVLPLGPGQLEPAGKDPSPSMLRGYPSMLCRMWDKGEQQALKPL